MNNVYLFQPQYAVEIRKETNYWLPYSVGCLWSYVSQFDHIVDYYDLDRIFFKRDSPESVLSQIQAPVLCAFSCYVWNEQYCLEVARQIKIRWPNCHIIFGGPQTSEKMLDHKFIDSIILGEGELAFLELLTALKDQTPIKQVYSKARIQDLSILPSPYATGVFEKILEENPNAVWAMTLETNRGCPYACTFCDWGSTTYSKIKTFDLSRIQADLQWAKNHRVSYIFVADANFGIYKQRDLEIAKMMRQATDGSAIEAINLQYAKNGTEHIFQIAQVIGPYGRGVTVSVQSMNESTLTAIKRSNLEINNIKKLMELSEKYQVGTYTEVILGLPNESKESWRQGLTDLLELGQHNSIDVWFAQLLENSELNNALTKKLYQIQTTRIQDYMALDQDHDDIVEFIEIVKSTSTMTTDDLIDCYMYAWMIVQLHTAGYTQIIARYCRGRVNLSYRNFYDCLYDQIQTDPIIGPCFDQLKQTVTDYLHKGQLSKGRGGHALHTRSYEYLYEHRSQVFDLAMQAAQTLGHVVPKIILELQENFIFSAGQSQHVICTDFDIFNAQEKSTVYKLNPRLTEVDEEDFYSFRRKGLLKNQITTD